MVSMAYFDFTKFFYQYCTKHKTFLSLKPDSWELHTNIILKWVMLTSAARHWLRIQFRKVLTSLLWEMKRTVKTLVTFFSFSIKTFFN